MQPLFDYAHNLVPEGMRKYTPIIFGATAGMRMLSEADQKNILDSVTGILQNLDFLFIKPDWARVITGQQEGAYLWLT